MSRHMNLGSHLAKVEPGNRESLLQALIDISDGDCDFSGENGLEYLWEEVWKANGFDNMDDYEEKNEYNSDEDDSYEEIKLKYESNMDYLLDKVRNIENDEDCIRAYIEGWIGNDGYYGEYDLNWLKNDDGKIIALSIAYMCG